MNHQSSTALISAQVHFLDTKLSLVHIPLHLYPYFVQAILQLILPAESTHLDGQEGEDLGGGGGGVDSSENARPRRPWVYEHPFVNVSVTPVECSVVCSAFLARTLFEPIRAALDPALREHVSIGAEEYVVIQVDGEGPDAGQRVLELSSPLAMNGISIFFISTYFSDYILVPVRSRRAVINALESGDFVFSKESEGFVNVSSPLMRPQRGHARHASSSSSLEQSQPPSYFAAPSPPCPASPVEPRPPGTPPPSSVVELEARTFRKLKEHRVVPRVDPGLRLVQCAGRKDTLRGGTGTHSSSVAAQQKLQLGLVKCLTTLPRARFISVTLTDSEPASVLLERRLLQNFDSLTHAEQDDDVLLGNKEDALVPILLDLRDLPMESPGIVCGIAGRLVGGVSALDPPLLGGAGTGIDMSYLSTARAGAVMVAEMDLDVALRALRSEHDPSKAGLPVDGSEPDGGGGGGGLHGDW